MPKPKKLVLAIIINNKRFEYFQLKIFFFLLIFLKVVKYGIKNCICPTLVIVNLKITLKKFFYLPNLLRTEIFCIYKTIKIIVIDQEKNFIFAIF